MSWTFAFFFPPHLNQPIPIPNNINPSRLVLLRTHFPSKRHTTPTPAPILVPSPHVVILRLPSLGPLALARHFAPAEDGGERGVDQALRVACVRWMDTCVYGVAVSCFVLLCVQACPLVHAVQCNPIQSITLMTALRPRVTVTSYVSPSTERWITQSAESCVA